MIQVQTQSDSPMWCDAETGILLAQMRADFWSAEQTLRWGFTRFRHDGAIVTAFGPEGMVLIDLASRIYPGFRIVTVDTGYLFPETQALMETVERRYRVRIERLEPELSPERQAQVFGEALWSRQPDRCCEMRKVAPLRKKLLELRAWFSGIRRGQTAVRAAAQKVEWDAKFGLWKLNPLADWDWEQVWEYIRSHKVPYNALHDLNYTSIGCTHCTRAVLPGEDLRAGRWSGFGKTECGLHTKE